MHPASLGGQREGVSLRKVSYSVQKTWLWIGQILSPVIVLKGIAFQEMVLDPVITIDVNHTGRRVLDVDHPSYIPGRLIGKNYQFEKVEALDGKPFSGFYYCELKPVVIFGFQDATDLRCRDGKTPVKGHPEFEIRRVHMG